MSRLVEMNADIQGRLAQVNLFAELNDDETYYDELLGALKAARTHMSPQQIAKNVPYAMSYFMVLHGVFKYREGDYWQGILELDVNHKTIWSQAFIEVLRSYGMPRFDVMIQAESALPYITRILMHGGIPKHSLPDYFREFLSRYFRTARKSNTPLVQYKNEWFEQSHAIDKPVVRFLEYGGTFANDWVERTVQMAMIVDEYIKRNKSVAFLSQAVYRDAPVPVWVTQAYWEYRKTTKTVEVRTQDINAPRLSLLYEQTIIVDLPTQELLVGASNAVRWVFTYGNADSRWTDVVPVFAHIRGHLLHVEATAKELAVRGDVFNMQIELYRGDDLIRAWKYPTQRLVFRLQRSQYAFTRGDFKIPGTHVQILTREPIDVLVDGVVVEPDTDGESWLYTVDGNSCEEVLYNGEIVPFVESDEDLAPQLRDGEKTQLLQPTDSAPVYVTLPNVHIPLSRNNTQAEQAKQLRVALFCETTKDVVYNRTRISEMTAAVEWHARSCVLSLAALTQRLVPGLYRLELSSETRSARLFFSYMPGFEVTHQSPPIVPIIASPKPQITIAALPAGWVIEHENRRIDADGASVLLYPEGTEAGSIVLRSATDELHLPVVFPHIHVRMLDRVGAELAVNTVYQQDAVWYQEHLPIIEAYLSPWNAPDIAELRMSAEVEVAQNDVTQTLAVRSNAGRRWFAVDTGAASDTIQHSLGGNAQITLRLAAPSVDCSQSVLTLQKMVNVEQLRVSWAPVLEKFRITAEWDAPESPSNWRMVFWSLQRPWQKVDVRPMPPNRCDAKYIVTTDDFRAGESYLVGIVSTNRDNTADEAAVRNTSTASTFPPDSNSFAVLQVPGTRPIRTAEDTIAALFTGVQSNTELLAKLYNMPRSNDENAIKVFYRLMVRLHQEVVHLHRSGHLLTIQEVFESEIRPTITRLYETNRFCFLIAVLKLTTAMRQFTLFDRELVQYLAYHVSRELFDVVLKAEIRGGLAESHITPLVQRPLEDADMLLLRKHGIFLVEEYDELFVATGITDALHVHGIPNGFIDATWQEVLQAPQELSYEEAVFATSMIPANPASQFPLHRWKNERIRAWRERLLPIIQVWLVRTAIAERRQLRMHPMLWWNKVGAEAVLQKLNTYTPERGDLRDYLMEVLP